jgi:xylulokinase
LSAAGAETGITEKLGRMDHYDAPVGGVHSYFVEKYHVGPRATVLCGTGDNPATLLGCGGSLVISLGSSYTVNGMLAAEGDAGSTPAAGGGSAGAEPAATAPGEPAEPSEPEYNVFGYLPGSAMALSVITNGTKVHDEFRRHYSPEASWEAYSALAGDRRVTADEPLLLPYLQDESVPAKQAGIVRDGFSETDAQANIRALHISQAVSLRLHATHVTAPDSLAVVGGGSQNDTLRSFISDAFGAATYRIRNGDFAAPFGCAVAAARSALGLSYEEAVERYVQVEAGSRMEPRGEAADVYRELTERYERLEASV